MPRISAEWVTRSGSASLAVRAGYAFLWSPAPDMRGQQSLLDNTRHVMTVGFGGALAGKLPVRLDLFAQWHRLMHRTYIKDPAMQQPGDDPAFDKLSTSGNVLVAGAALGVDL